MGPTYSPAQHLPLALMRRAISVAIGKLPAEGRPLPERFRATFAARAERVPFFECFETIQSGDFIGYLCRGLISQIADEGLDIAQVLFLPYVFDCFAVRHRAPIWPLARLVFALFFEERYRDFFRREATA